MNQIIINMNSQETLGTKCESKPKPLGGGCVELQWKIKFLALHEIQKSGTVFNLNNTTTTPQPTHGTWISSKHIPSSIIPNPNLLYHWKYDKTKKMNVKVYYTQAQILDWSNKPKQIKKITKDCPVNVFIAGSNYIEGFEGKETYAAEDSDVNFTFQWDMDMYFFTEEATPSYGGSEASNYVMINTVPFYHVKRNICRYYYREDVIIQISSS